MRSCVRKAAATSSPVVFTFESSWERETQKREVLHFFRLAVQQCTSPLRRCRLEGLREALQVLLQWAQLATLEARHPPPPPFTTKTVSKWKKKGGGGGRRCRKEKETIHKKWSTILSDASVSSSSSFSSSSSVASSAASPRTRLDEIGKGMLAPYNALRIEYYRSHQKEQQQRCRVCAARASETPNEEEGENPQERTEVAEEHPSPPSYPPSYGEPLDGDEKALQRQRRRWPWCRPGERPSVSAIMALCEPLPFSGAESSSSASSLFSRVEAEGERGAVHPTRVVKREGKSTGKGKKRIGRGRRGSGEVQGSHTTRGEEEKKKANTLHQGDLMEEEGGRWRRESVSNASSASSSFSSFSSSVASSSRATTTTAITSPSTCHRRLRGSVQWDLLQDALASTDLTSAIFHTIFVLRPDTRLRMQLGSYVEVHLSPAEVRTWSTLPSSRSTTTTVANPPPSPLLSAAGAHTPTPTTMMRRSSLSLLEHMTAVQFDEQELALRLLQGLAVSLYSQRGFLVESCLVHYVTEVCQCLVKHVDVVYEEQLAARRGGVPSSSPPSPHSTPVFISSPQLHVLLALFHTVEAACHYQPMQLSRLVQAGGVQAMLEVAYHRAMPFVLRTTALETISVLLQEVTPLRKAMATATAIVTHPLVSMPTRREAREHLEAKDETQMKKNEPSPTITCSSACSTTTTSSSSILEEEEPSLPRLSFHDRDVLHSMLEKALGMHGMEVKSSLSSPSWTRVEGGKARDGGPSGGAVRGGRASTATSPPLTGWRMANGGKTMEAPQGCTHVMPVVNDAPYRLDVVSASRLEAAVRDWFRRKGLSQGVETLLENWIQGELGTSSSSTPQRGQEEEGGNDNAPKWMTSGKPTVVWRTLQRAKQQREEHWSALLTAMDRQQQEGFHREQE